MDHVLAAGSHLLICWCHRSSPVSQQGLTELVYVDEEGLDLGLLGIAQLHPGRLLRLQALDPLQLLLSAPLPPLPSATLPRGRRGPALGGGDAVPLPLPLQLGVLLAAKGPRVLQPPLRLSRGGRGRGVEAGDVNEEVLKGELHGALHLDEAGRRGQRREALAHVVKEGVGMVLHVAWPCKCGVGMGSSRLAP